MKILITRTFCQHGQIFEAGKEYTVREVSTNPQYYEVTSNEPAQSDEKKERVYKRAVPHNVAITNQDK